MRTREQQMMDAADRYADEVCDGSCTGAQVAETINDFCAGWRAADSYPNWISVEERLPEETEEVLAYNAENEEVIACDYYNRMFICWPEEFNESITHWMPMPQPPRKEENNETK